MIQKFRSKLTGRTNRAGSGVSFVRSDEG